MRPGDPMAESQKSRLERLEREGRTDEFWSKWDELKQGTAKDERPGL